MDLTTFEQCKYYQDPTYFERFIQAYKNTKKTYPHLTIKLVDGKTYMKDLTTISTTRHVEVIVQTITKYRQFFDKYKSAYDGNDNL